MQRRSTKRKHEQKAQSKVLVKKRGVSPKKYSQQSVETLDASAIVASLLKQSVNSLRKRRSDIFLHSVAKRLTRLVPLAIQEEVTHRWMLEFHTGFASIFQWLSTADGISFVRCSKYLRPFRKVCLRHSYWKAGMFSSTGITPMPYGTDSAHVRHYLKLHVALDDSKIRDLPKARYYFFDHNHGCLAAKGLPIVCFAETPRAFVLKDAMAVDRILPYAPGIRLLMAYCFSDALGNQLFNQSIMWTNLETLFIRFSSAQFRPLDRTQFPALKCVVFELNNFNDRIRNAFIKEWIVTSEVKPRKKTAEDSKVNASHMKLRKCKQIKTLVLPSFRNREDIYLEQAYNGTLIALNKRKPNKKGSTPIRIPQHGKRRGFRRQHRWTSGMSTSPTPRPVVSSDLTQESSILPFFHGAN